MSEGREPPVMATMQPSDVGRKVDITEDREPVRVDEETAARAMADALVSAQSFPTGPHQCDLHTAREMLAFLKARPLLAGAVVSWLVPEHEERERQLAIVTMERDWVLGAWAASCGVPLHQAEADMLAWSKKWREVAVDAALRSEEER